MSKMRKYARSGTGTKVVRAKVDSGAAISVASRNTFPGYKISPTYESENGIEYTAASGHTIPDEGIRHPIVKTKSGDIRGLSMRVAETTVPLISVFDMINKDQRVVFDRVCRTQKDWKAHQD